MVAVGHGQRSHKHDFISWLPCDICDHTLQEWLDVLQSRAGNRKPEEPTGKMTTTEPKEEEKMKKEEADRKEVGERIEGWLIMEKE